MASSTSAPIGLVVEGTSEYYAVPRLLQRLGLRYCTPAVFHGQPVELPPEAVGKRALPYVRAQSRKGVSKVVVIVDREDREQCAPDFAAGVRCYLLANLGARTRGAQRQVTVVSPDRKIENWLIADRAGLANYALIRSGAKTERRSNVDGLDGDAELRRLIARGRTYEKGEMTGDLASCIRPDRAEVRRRSRSLRKFLKAVR